jgi:hypothetical protein
MSSTNGTKKVADEFGKQVFESLHAEQRPEQPYFDFLEYREYLKSKNTSLPNAEEIVGCCSIDFGTTVQGAAYK